VKNGFNSGAPVFIQDFLFQKIREHLLPY